LRFTDGIISKYSTPTITTVSQSGIKMGNRAAKILINRLEADEKTEEEEEEENYKTEIIETSDRRESTS
jgi:LacI family transcriptional regulator